tara:strand:- start:401 stop:1135 length:735 start_codon:yes stop_codon:yes gene_type:complete
MNSITLENVSCSFSCFNKISLKSLLKRKKNLKEFQKFHALKDINLTIDKGDRIGLIGENGSGKSTFLRLVSGIYKQSSGRIIRNMSVKCLLDKSFLVSTDLAGVYAARAEYVSYFGSFVGFEDFLEEICDFSGLGEFIYKSMSTYSDGMRVRLLFSILTSPFFKYECLALDEGIGMADREFNTKASKRFQSFLGQSNTLLMASHSSDLLKDFCTKGLVLKKGYIVFFGNIIDAIKCYENSYHLN